MTTFFPLRQQQKIKQKIQPLLQQPPAEPIHIQSGGRSYIVKFTRRESGRLWRESMSTLACWLLFGVAVKPNAFRTGDINYEAKRLRNLQPHIAVPRLLIEESNYIVMEHCGEPIEPMLRCEQGRAEFLPRVIDSLLELHKAKQWHGGAQVRNLTLRDNTIFRIDFEEKTGDVLPLALAQAYDLFLCFNSLTKYMHFDIDLGEKLLTRYLRKHQEPQILAALDKVLKLSFHLSRTVDLFGKAFGSRSDIKRTLYFSTVLNRSLKNHYKNANLKN